MSIKEELKKIRESINKSKTINRDYEFEADLEDHPIPEQNLYRLHFVNYHRIGENYGLGPNNIGVIDWPLKPFMIPDGMSREDAFSVLSYLTDYIETNLNIKPCSCESVSQLNNAIDLERLGFKRIENSDKDLPDAIDLFTVTGRLVLFKASKYYPKYFEWYKENVSLDEVKEIYKRCGKEFYDLEITKTVSKEPEKIKKKIQ